MQSKAIRTRDIPRPAAVAGDAIDPGDAERKRFRQRLGVVFALALVTACVTPPQHTHDGPHTVRHEQKTEPEPARMADTIALDLSTISDLEDLIPELADKRVVLVGEIHNRFEHHEIQLEIIRRLHAARPRLAIGMEAFQQPFQGYLDDYVAGELTERELLRGTEYYQRWRFDFRHYAPILRYAREHRLPVVALNLPAELTRKVGRESIEGLSEEERAQLPDEIDRSDTAYEDRLKDVYEQHPMESIHSFDNFVEVQLLWDEGMAERAADYLKTHPDHAMVVLAGRGHLAYGSGIPRRLERRLQESTAVVLNGWDGTLEPGLADYLLLPEQRSLPAAGRFGALLNDDDGVLRIDELMPDSPFITAGVKLGDRFVSIDDEPVTDMADLRVSMWDKMPGDIVSVVVRRKNWFTREKELAFEIELM